MNELRWILIGFGIVLLAGIYLWGRRSGAAVAEEVVLRTTRPEPSMQPHGFTEVRREPAPAPEDIPVYDGDDLPDGTTDSAPSDDYEITAARPALTRSERTGRADAIRGRMEQSRALEGDASRSFKETETAELPRPTPPPDFRRGRVEPRLGDDDVTEEVQVQMPASTAVVVPAPTLSSSETPAPRRVDRRKILSLRLSTAPQRIEGAKLHEVLQSELLEHGKYDVFHRLHSDGQSIFSIASMVEPGTFDLEKMNETQYAGITMFAQLPGPVPGMHALNELVACARRLHQGLGGVLQDDRGIPLTVHRIERMRQEVRDFERPAAGTSRTGRGEGYQE